MAEDEIIKKHTRAVYTTIMDKEKKWLHKGKDILLEVLIIVFAVSVSIWLHNWSEARKDKKDASIFYKGLKDDLQADVKEMMHDRGVLLQLSQYTRYFEKVGAGVVADQDSIAQYAWIFFSAVQINPAISRFEALKGSGKLDIIEDKNRLYNIIDLYQKIFPFISRMNQAFNSLNADKIDPFIGDQLQLDNSGKFVNAVAVLHSSKMRLLLIQLEGAAGNCISAYTTGIDKSNEILKQLTSDRSSGE